MVDVFLINLDRHTGRLRFMETQLALLSVPFTRFRAVNGYDPAEIASNDKARFANLSQGEIGAWESHRGVWREIIRRGQPAIVLEDDVMLSSDFGRLAFDKDLLATADIVKLDYFRQPSTYGVRQIPVGGDDRHVQRLVGSERLASAYLVTPTGAEKLLEGSRNYFQPVDDLIFQMHSRLFWSLRIWKIMPAVATQMRFAVPSEDLPHDIEDGIQNRMHTIKKDPKPGMDWRARCMLWVRRLKDLDVALVRNRRKRTRLSDFKAQEGVVTALPEFVTADRTHIEQGLADMR